jgi:uncharacterized phage protein (TIGR01671 family)
MREIKFRAWNPRLKIMFQVGDAYGTTHPLDCCVYVTQKQEVILMQFTGLHDRNGKEIWEGDIVRQMFRKKPFQIIFYDGSFRGWSITDESPTPDMRGFHFDSFEADGSEVNGNIYENPELLEGK